VAAVVEVSSSDTSDIAAMYGIGLGLEVTDWVSFSLQANDANMKSMLLRVLFIVMILNLSWLKMRFVSLVGKLLD